MVRRRVSTRRQNEWAAGRWCRSPDALGVEVLDDSRWACGGRLASAGGHSWSRRRTTRKGDEGRQPLEGGRTESSDASQRLQRAEGAERIAIGHETPRHRRPDIWETVDLRLGGAIQI